jgi:hypothetical protein
MVVGGWNGRRRVRSVLSKTGFGGCLPVYGELVRHNPVVPGSATPALDPADGADTRGCGQARRAERRTILSSPPYRTATRISWQLTRAPDHGACRLIQRTRPGPGRPGRGGPPRRLRARLGAAAPKVPRPPARRGMERRQRPRPVPASCTGAGRPGAPPHAL